MELSLCTEVGGEITNLELSFPSCNILALCLGKVIPNLLETAVLQHSLYLVNYKQEGGCVWVGG